MAERVEAWWARRQFSRGLEIPYEVGAYREAWASYPALVRQYHPELNAGIVLSQIPPAADVLLLWQCEAGHLFAATPSEQRARPGGTRRRSSWCPECTRQAVPRKVRPAGVERTRPPARKVVVCDRTPALPVGEPFRSECAPQPASAVEAGLRADLFARLAVTPEMNAVRVGRAFYRHLEVWPDILLPELRVAVEYDSTGKHGLEHVGQREDADRRKDRLLRSSGWEVVRIRTGRLDQLGPFDIQASGTGKRTTAQLVDALRAIRGPLLVDAYLIGPA